MKNKLNVNYVKNKTELAKAKAAHLKGQTLEMQILGSGPINRDGVPKLPPEQREVKNWPVLDLGIHPEVAMDTWTLLVKGLCRKPTTWDQKIFSELPVVEDVSDFHCVTGWSRFDLSWKGIRFSDIAKHAEILSEAKYVLISASDGYSTNLPLEEAMKADVLLVYEVDGKPLPKEHGGPVRMITPQLWAWKGAKWVNSIEFLAQDQRGFWELRGYSNSALPWLNDRYTQDEQD